MRLPEDAEVHWGRIAALGIYLVAVVVLVVFVPVVGWVLAALTLLTLGVELNPSRRSRLRGRRGRLDDVPPDQDDGTPRGNIY